MRTTEGNQIYSILRAKVGRESAITAPELARLIGFPPGNERRVRRIINDECALWPTLVVSEAGKGYFIAQTYEELEQCDSWLGKLMEAAALRRAEFRTLARKHGFRFGGSEPRFTTRRAA